jgi:hypothetical protein
LSPDHTRWIAARPGFFLPVRALSRVFRGKFVAGLRQLHAAGRLGFHGDFSPLAAPAAFAAMLRQVFRSAWVVYAKPPFGGTEHALRYLGCYTHRVAISNHRLVALEDREVVFRWRDSAHHNKKRLLRLALDEFLRRFFSPRAATGFRTDSALRVPRSPAARPVAAAVLCPAGGDCGAATGHSPVSPTCFTTALDVPTVCWRDGDCRAVHGCRSAMARSLPR